MSYTTPPSGYLVPEQPGGSPARPGTVTFASFLLYLMALLSLVSAALAVYQATLLTQEKLLTIYKDGGYPADQAEAAAAVTPVVTYVTGGFALLLAVVYIILAVFVGKGKQWARITSWVVVGLFGVCCGLVGVAAMGAGNSFSGMGAPTGIDTEKITTDTAALLPDWLAPTTTVLSVISLIAAITVVVLLLLPPSNPYFRKQEPVWTPPTYPAP
jgi:type IV secretory pathway VirB2 component (pilin)